MRQILNYLELAYKTKATQLLEVKDAGELNKFTKDSAVSLTNFEATRKLLTRFHGSGMPLRERMDCFFIDSDFVPIMVHENYLSSVKKGKMNRKDFHKLVKANDAFVLADQIDTRIRK
jgi:replication factor C subunit 1